jgi:hypothetical protein
VQISAADQAAPEQLAKTANGMKSTDCITTETSLSLAVRQRLYRRFQFNKRSRLFICARREMMDKTVQRISKRTRFIAHKAFISFCISKLGQGSRVGILCDHLGYPRVKPFKPAISATVLA